MIENKRGERLVVQVVVKRGRSFLDTRRTSAEATQKLLYVDE